LKFYADVHRTKKNNEKFRIIYTTDGTTFKHVDSFSEIPAGPGDKLFMDTIPPQHTDGAIELLRKGVEIYYLRRLTLLEKMRREHKLPKTTRGDIKTLMNIEERWFRRVTEDFLVMRRMILAYRSLLKTHQQLLNKYRALSEAEREVLKPAISSIEKQLKEMAKKITEEAGKRYPAYNVLLEGLGIDGSLAGREALAELLTYADFVNSSLRGLKKLLGLYKPINSSRTDYWKLYDGKLRYAVNRLAIAFYNNRPNGRQCWELVKQIKQLVVTASGTGIGPRQRGEKPQSSIHRGLRFFNRRRISPAGSMFLIPVSGVPRLTTGDIQTNQSLPQSFLFFYSSLNPSDPQPTQTLSLTTLT
jgi:hypothetical protein